jgi:hypothetical protein
VENPWIQECDVSHSKMQLFGGKLCYATKT